LHGASWRGWARWRVDGGGHHFRILHVRSAHLDRERDADQLLPGTTFGAPFGLALYYLASGDLDRCADWLEKAIEQRDPWVSFLLNVGNIGGRVMWSHLRWPRLAQLMNVTPERAVT
jgi:hypothetical protein